MKRGAGRCEQPGPLPRCRTSAGRGSPRSASPGPAPPTAAALRLANRLVGNAEGAAGAGDHPRRPRGAGARRRWWSRSPAPRCPVDASTDAPRRLRHRRSSCPPAPCCALGAPTRGLRSYLAVRGGLDVRAGARARAATDLLVRARPGAAARRATAAGRAATRTARCPASTWRRPHPPPTRVIELRVVPGPRADWFTDAGRALLETTWTVVQPQQPGRPPAGGPPRWSAPVDDELPSEGMVARRRPGAAGSGAAGAVPRRPPGHRRLPGDRSGGDRGPLPRCPGHPGTGDPLARGLGSRPVREGGRMTTPALPSPRSDARWLPERPASCSGQACGPRRRAGAPAGRRPT